ncbi:hypothetical protein D3C73_1258840 [compost metagenome]
MPVSRSGVTLVAWMLPSGVAISRPPANGAPSGTLWQATQSLSRATYSPRLTSAGSISATATGSCASGEAGSRVTYQASRPAAITHGTANPPAIFANRWFFMDASMRFR